LDGFEESMKLIMEMKKERKEVDRIIEVSFISYYGWDKEQNG